MTRKIDAPSYSVVVFGTDDNSFNVMATLLVKGRHASLINSGFTRGTAREIAGYLHDEGLTLDEVFIIHGDPDYYFGLEQIIRAYPDVRAYSTEQTAAHIAETVMQKLKFWSPQLKGEAPDNIILPKTATGGTLDILGESFEIFSAEHEHKRVSLWDRKSKVLIGGIDVFNEIHVFLADTGTDEELRNWLDRLRVLKRLNAEIVIPSHGTLEGSFDSGAIDATEEYLSYALTALKDKTDSSALSNALLKRFPSYVNAGVVELGAKVLTKEITWP